MPGDRCVIAAALRSLRPSSQRRDWARVMGVCAATALLPLLLPLPVDAQALRGLVLDQTNIPLPGVRIELHRDGRIVESTTTQMDGTFVLPQSEPGDVVEATLEAFETARVPAAEAARIVLLIARTTMMTEVTATMLTSSGAAMEKLGSTMAAPLAQKLPARRPRILQSLPLLPSVVRGGDGQLRIGGTRPHESSLWIDGFDVTDPVTGTTAIDMPNESVKGMAVVRDPISVTFDSVIGSLASIETMPGGDEFNAGFQGFIPRPRLNRQWGLGKIEAFFPRAYASGRVGRLRYFGSIELNFERVPVPGVTSRAGDPNRGTTGVTSFSRVDFDSSPRNNITLEGLFAPNAQSNVGLSTLRGTEAAPDVDTSDLFVGFVDRYVVNSRDLLTLRLGMVAHSTTFTSQGRGTAILSPAGWRENWFSVVDHDGSRRSVSLTWDRAGISARGTHSLSVSGNLRHRSMTASISHAPIDVEDDDVRLVRRIEFGPDVHLDTADTIPGVGLRDLWDVSARLQLDLGIRADWSNGAAVSPRFGLRYLLDESGGTVVKGSIGRFVGRAPLGAFAFAGFPARRDTTFDPQTGAALSTAVYTPTLGSLVLPRADGIAIDIEHQIRPGLDLQAGVRQRLGSRLPLVTLPVGGGSLLLSSDGTSRYRELQVSVRQLWREDLQAFLSYVRSSSKGDSNDFGTLYTSLDAPMLEPNGVGPTPVDVPHRLRGWATVGLPRRIVVSPALEWRTGFPYSIVNVYQHNVGSPNNARFPAYFAVDLTVFKTWDLFERKLDLGLQFFNATAHANPRDVIPVQGSVQFGELSNDLGLTLGGYMQIRW